MTVNRGAQRAPIAIFFALLAVLYGFAWFAPAVGLYYEDAAWLVTAKAIAAGHGYVVASLPVPVPETKDPPFFPAVLALFALVSSHAVWLKVLPLGCLAGWLALTRRLLLKMGASHNDAWWLVGLTAACPAIVFLGTTLIAESLFALLVTAALLMLLEERALAAGIFAGLATLTLTAGAPLIVACIVTLVVRGRLRGAAIFAAVAMALAAPWFGWSLAHAVRDYAAGKYVPGDIFTGLAASEKLVVLGRNAVLLIGGPVAILSGGWTGSFEIAATVLVLLWCFIVRRQLVPDLFVALYCLMLLCRTSPPERFLAPILPLILWIAWRVLRLMKPREALAAMVVIVTAVPLWADAVRLPATVANGYFAAVGQPPDNWNEMRKLFGFIRENTPENSVLLANLDPVFYLNTGRRTVRGFAPNGFDLYYAPRQTAVTPDRLSHAILAARVNYVVLTPDRGLAESASFHKSVEALERGGVLAPVSLPGESRDYRLLQVVAPSGF